MRSTAFMSGVKAVVICARLTSQCFFSVFPHSFTMSFLCIVVTIIVTIELSYRYNCRLLYALVRKPIFILRTGSIFVLEPLIGLTPIVSVHLLQQQQQRPLASCPKPPSNHPSETKNSSISRVVCMKGDWCSPFTVYIQNCTFVRLETRSGANSRSGTLYSSTLDWVLG